MIRRLTLALAVLAAITFNAHALQFDQNVTNNVIYGTGNTNGSFTTDRNATAGVEVGLRAHVRYDLATDSPLNVFNSNGNGTYNMDAGHPASPATRARWNFDWSVNSNYNGNGGVVGQFNYLIGIDYDAGAGTNYQTFDPITPVAVTCADHSFGTNGTGQSAGAEAPPCPGGSGPYAFLVFSNNLVQNSWNLDFFDGGPFTFNPDASGLYSVFFEVLNARTGGVVARSEIQVCVGAVACPSAVPEPAPLALLGLGLAGLGFARRRKS